MEFIKFHYLFFILNKTTMKKLLTAILFLLIFIHINAQNNCLWIRYPSISPDGKLIVFSYKGDLYLVSSEGGNATILTKNSNYDYAPVWSPDSKNIAFSSDREGNFDIYTTDIFGSTPNRLTFNSVNEKPTSFSSDGTEILFTATIQDNAENASFPKPYLSELYSIPANGGRISQILSSPAIDAKYNKTKRKLFIKIEKVVKIFGVNIKNHLQLLILFYLILKQINTVN